MNRIILRATTFDRTVAAWIKKRTTRRIERWSKWITLAGDERVLGVVGAGIWLVTMICGDHRQRRVVNHLAVATAVTVALPHVLKSIFAQERPDRTVRGNRRGIPRSGRAFDAFPSGHAMHLGAIASGLAAIYPRLAALPWALCAGLAATRVAVLAHWPTDVAAGFVLGSAVEHCLRPFDSFREALKAQGKYVARAQDQDGSR